MLNRLAMFETLATDQAKLITFYTNVLDWKVTYNEAGFADIHFSPAVRHLLGSIGQAEPRKAGWNPGTAFYIQVPNLKTTLERVTSHNGTIVMEPTEINGFRFAINDPESNLIGIIEPFES